LLAGRAEVDDERVDNLALKDLDRTTAQALLTREVGGLGVNKRFIDAVLDQIGTNPLSVRLAGELLRQEGRAGLGRAKVRDRLLFRVGQEEIQGVLYRRILDHLDDDDVRKIANPGLVVRRIDAGVIQRVLAKPCGLGELSAAKATDLLERLGREASLVEGAGPGVYVHRADVRAIMLPLIERDDAKKAGQIRRAAVKFHGARFKRRGDLFDKTEELYHRLMLAQPAKTLTAAWDRDAAVLLQPALEEFPPSAQAYLAERLGWTVDPSVFRAAEDDSWAEQAARICRQRLDAGDPNGALSLARERDSERVRTLIDPIIVEALATLGKTDEALRQADSTIRWAATKGRWQTFVAVSAMAARISEDAGRWEQALELLRGAREISEENNDAVSHLAAGVAMLRVQRRAGVAPTHDDGTLRNEVLVEGRALRQRDRRRNPTLVRDLAAEFGAEAPDLVAAATELVGVDLSSDAGSELVGALSSEDRLAFNDYNRITSSHASDPGLPDAVAPTPPSDPGDTLDWLQSGTSVEQSSRVNDYLGNSGDTAHHPGWNDAVATAFRHDSDARAY
jgi:tetratricopeptide (TPR) repeat protein